jgi:hypothetical protein
MIQQNNTVLSNKVKRIIEGAKMKIIHQVLKGNLIRVNITDDNDNHLYDYILGKRGANP